MIYAVRGMAVLRTVPIVIFCVWLAISSSCARYEKRPLVPEEYRNVLNKQTADNPELLKAVGNFPYSPVDGIVLQEAEIVCLYLNPRLRSARLDAKVPAATSRYAGLWDDPEISADALEILDDVEEPWILGSALSFTIPISGRLSVARSQAKAEAKAALVDVWVEEQSVLKELREAWASWMAAHRSMHISRDLLNRLSPVVEITNRREELGELITAEAIAFRLEEARVKLDLSQLETNERQSRTIVLALMGLTMDSDVVLHTGNEMNSQLADGQAELAFDRSPQVLMTAARYEAAEEALRLEVRKQYPDLTLGPIWGKEEGLNRFGFGFSIPIPILNANRGGIAEAHAVREAARAEWEQSMQESLTAFELARSTLSTAIERKEILRSTIVPMANQQVAEVRRLTDLGEINTLLILESLQTEREAELDLIEAEADVLRAQSMMLAIQPSSVPTFEFNTEEDFNR